MLPGGRWHVHDGDRPLPRVITPGTCSTQETPGKAPSDAVVLFDGKDLAHWQSDRGGPAGWNIDGWSSGDSSRCGCDPSAVTSSATASSTSNSPHRSLPRARTRGEATVA